MQPVADDVDPNESPISEPVTAVDAADAAAALDAADAAAQRAEPLPTMADLDRVALELDEVDARLAALDGQRPEGRRVDS